MLWQPQNILYRDILSNKVLTSMTFINGVPQNNTCCDGGGVVPVLDSPGSISKNQVWGSKFMMTWTIFTQTTTQWTDNTCCWHGLSWAVRLEGYPVLRWGVTFRVQGKDSYSTTLGASMVPYLDKVRSHPQPAQIPVHTAPQHILLRESHWKPVSKSSRSIDNTNKKSMRQWVLAGFESRSINIILDLSRFRI